MSVTPVSSHVFYDAQGSFDDELSEDESCVSSFALPLLEQEQAQAPSMEGRRVEPQANSSVSNAASRSFGSMFSYTGIPWLASKVAHTTAKCNGWALNKASSYIIGLSKQQRSDCERAIKACSYPPFNNPNWIKELSKSLAPKLAQLIKENSSVPLCIVKGPPVPVGQLFPLTNDNGLALVSDFSYDIALSLTKNFLDHLEKHPSFLDLIEQEFKSLNTSNRNPSIQSFVDQQNKQKIQNLCDKILDVAAGKTGEKLPCPGLRSIINTQLRNFAPLLLQQRLPQHSTDAFVNLLGSSSPEETEALKEQLTHSCGESSVRAVNLLSEFTANFLLGKNHENFHSFGPAILQSLEAMFAPKGSTPSDMEVKGQKVAEKIHELLGRDSRKALRKSFQPLLEQAFLLAANNLLPSKQSMKEKVLESAQFLPALKQITHSLHNHLSHYDNFQRNPHLPFQFHKALEGFHNDRYKEGSEDPRLATAKNWSQKLFQKAFPKGAKDLPVKEDLQETLFETLRDTVLPQVILSCFDNLLDEDMINAQIVETLKSKSPQSSDRLVVDNIMFILDSTLDLFFPSQTTTTEPSTPTSTASTIPSPFQDDELQEKVGNLCIKLGDIFLPGVLGTLKNFEKMGLSENLSSIFGAPVTESLQPLIGETDSIKSLSERVLKTSLLPLLEEKKFAKKAPVLTAAKKLELRNRAKEAIAFQLWNAIPQAFSQVCQNIQARWKEFSDRGLQSIDEHVENLLSKSEEQKLNKKHVFSYLNLAKAYGQKLFVRNFVRLTHWMIDKVLSFAFSLAGGLAMISYIAFPNATAQVLGALGSFLQNFKKSENFGKYLQDYSNYSQKKAEDVLNFIHAKDPHHNNRKIHESLLWELGDQLIAQL